MSSVSCENTKFAKKLSLNAAIMFGDIKKVKKFIKNGADVNKPGRKSWTPLHTAAKHGHPEIVKFLIKKGASVDSEITDSKGRSFTPLDLAVLKNNLKCAKLLIKNGASVSPKTEDVFHPIHIAVFKGHMEMAALLLDYGAKVNLRFNNNFFKVFKHTMLGNLWMDHNLPLLHCSILRKFKNLTQLLLKNEADVNLKTSLGKTTLMQAVEVNNVELVEYLIKDGGNVNERDIFGQPVLHFTIINANRRASMYSKEEANASQEKLKIVKLLVNHGVDVNARFPANRDHSSVIHYMITCGFHLGVEYLLCEDHCDPAEIDLRTVFSGQFRRQICTPDIANDLEYIDDLIDSFESIMYTIMQWAIVRDMAGLPVNKAIILKYPIHRWIHLEDFTREINSFKERVMDQINFMRGTSIGPGSITFWRLLTCQMEELIRIMTNKTVNYLDLLEKSKCKFFNYFDLLKNRVRIAENRRVLRSQSAEIMFKIFAVRLPYDCYQYIVSFLSNVELETFVRYCRNGLKSYEYCKVV